MAFLRCGSVRFSEIVTSTVRFSEIVKPTVRFGAVFRCREPYGAVRRYVYVLRFGAVFGYRQTFGAVRCGFQEGKNPTVRCGAVNRTEPHRTDRKNRTVKNPKKLPPHMLREGEESWIVCV